VHNPFRPLPSHLTTQSIALAEPFPPFDRSTAASWFFVLAKTDMNVSPTKGMTGFVVETASEGVEIGKKEINMGQKCSDTRMVSFTDVFIPVRLPSLHPLLFKRLESD
jgi:hypothetical protein